MPTTIDLTCQRRLDMGIERVKSITDDVFDVRFEPFPFEIDESYLKQIFTAIPRNITKIIWKNNWLQEFLEQDRITVLAYIFACLPNTVTHLNLLDNTFKITNINIDDFINFLNRLPKTIKYLSLNLNVDDLTIENKKRLLEAAVRQDLEEFYLKLKSDQVNIPHSYQQSESFIDHSLQSIFDAFPANRKAVKLHLYLCYFEMRAQQKSTSYNTGAHIFFGSPKPPLTKLFEKINHNISLTSFICDNDFLSNLSMREKQLFIAALPDTVTTISLSGICQKDISAKNRTRQYLDAIRAIKPNVKELRLSGIRINDLDDYRQCMEEIVEAIPRTVTKLSFRYNSGLGYQSLETLKSFFARMPVGLEEIDLEGSSFENYENLDFLAEVVDQLGPNTKIAGLAQWFKKRILSETDPKFYRLKQALSDSTISQNTRATPAAQNFTFPAAYMKYYTERSAKEFCRNLLIDYIKQNSSGITGLFLSDRWDWHHVDLIRDDILPNFDVYYRNEYNPGYFRNFLIVKIEESGKKFNPEGRLAKLLDACMTMHLNDAKSPERLAAEGLVMTFLFQKGYATIKPQHHKSNAGRFLRIAERLNVDAQGVLFNRWAGSPEDSVSEKEQQMMYYEEPLLRRPKAATPG